MRHIIFSCCLLMLVGCSRMRARKELQRLSQIEICIPADLEVYCEGGFNRFCWIATTGSY